MNRLIHSAFCIVLLGAAAVSGCSGDDPKGQKISYLEQFGQEDLAEPETLDPTPYRSEITAVEDILYRGDPLTQADVGQIVMRVMRLHQKVVATEVHPIAKERGHRLLFLAQRADSGGTGYTAPELKSIRDDWERVRAEVFAQAGWFRSASAAVQRQSQLADG